jgi:sugar phosphate isomerase/epimerase
MKYRVFSLFTTALALGLMTVACTEKKAVEDAADDFPLYAKDNLLAWCIVPFDSEKRSPEQRARMLNELGIPAMAWDWRMEHLPLMAEEIEALRRHNIALSAVWFWVDGSGEGLLNEANEVILHTLAENGIRTDLWLSFPASFFEGLSEEEMLQKATEAVGQIRDRAAAIGCRVALYNHGDWFGEPANQVKIIQALGAEDVGIVYNFHHAHDQLDNFDSNIELMLPHLWTVNLNGMKAEGPKILPLGQGDLELEMMKKLRESGYVGSIGILGHVDDQDVRLVLQGNLDGMKKVLGEMGNETALRTY